MKIVYCGFDFFHTCLTEAISAGCELHAVFSMQVDEKLESNQRIRNACIGLGKELSIRAVTSDDIYRFADAGVDLLVTAAYKYRIPTEPLEETGIKGVNVHPTLLPEGRGPWPTPVAILRHIDRYGVTLHKLAKTFDAGDILLQEAFDIAPRENLETLSCRSQMVAARLIRHFLADVTGFWSKATPQINSSYWPVPAAADRFLIWSKSVDELNRVVRAFGKCGAYAQFHGKEWIVQDADGWQETHKLVPGAVVHETANEVVVAVKDGFLCVRSYAPRGDGGIRV